MAVDGTPSGSLKIKKKYSYKYKQNNLNSSYQEIFQSLFLKRNNKLKYTQNCVELLENTKHDL